MEIPQFSAKYYRFSVDFRGIKTDFLRDRGGIKMEKAPLILLVGKSGSGKNYFTKFAKEKLEMDEVISRTTREPRFAGEDTHLFVSRERAEREINNSLAYTYYCGNHYYVLEEDLKGKIFYVVDQKGVETFKSNCYDIPHIVVYYNVPFFVRAWRMFKRGDELKEIIKRLINDHKDFNKMKQLQDVEVKNMQQLTTIGKVVFDYKEYINTESIINMMNICVAFNQGGE